MSLLEPCLRCDALALMPKLHSGRLLMIKATNDEAAHCWKEQLFVLTHGWLLLFPSHQEPCERPLSSIPVHSFRGYFDPSASSWILEISGKGADMDNTIKERTWFLQTQSERNCLEWLENLSLAQDTHPTQPLAPLSLPSEALSDQSIVMQTHDPLLMRLVADPLPLQWGFHTFDDSDFPISEAAPSITSNMTSPAPSVSSRGSGRMVDSKAIASLHQQPQSQHHHQKLASNWPSYSNSPYQNVSHWGTTSSSRTPVLTQMGPSATTKSSDSKSVSGSLLSSLEPSLVEFGFIRKKHAAVSVGEGSVGRKSGKRWRKLNSVTVDFDIL
ncbi:hypothetical protein BJ741DRAFT_603471 [Chytriomyces cf. hyalinus JEL632]|nr:hypothetical protein BJ741DRAFT_603471 [Chytriomyces cf. hyalinus JEL632]